MIPNGSGAPQLNAVFCRQLEGRRVVGGVEDMTQNAQAAQRTATFLVASAVFVHPVVNALYGGLHRKVPDAFPILCGLFLVLSLTAWFQLYSQEYRVAWVMDMGWFLLGLWMVIIPYYILKREGRAGLARIGLFCLTWFAAWATAFAILIWVRVVNGGQ